MPDNTRIDAGDDVQETRASRASRLSLMKLSPMARTQQTVSLNASEIKISPKNSNGGRNTGILDPPHVIATAENKSAQLKQYRSDRDLNVNANGHPDNASGSATCPPESAHLPDTLRFVMRAGVRSPGTLETASNRSTRRQRVGGAGRTINVQPQVSEMRHFATTTTDSSSISSHSNSVLHLQRVRFAAMPNRFRLQTDGSSEVDRSTTNADAHSVSSVLLPETRLQQGVDRKQLQQVSSFRVARPEVARPLESLPLETCSLLETTNNCSRSLAAGERGSAYGVAGTFAKEEASGEAGRDWHTLGKIPLETRSLLEPLEQPEALSIALRREYCAVNKTSLLRRRGDRQQQKRRELEVNKRWLWNGSQVGGVTRTRPNAAATGECAISETGDNKPSTLARGGEAIIPLDHLSLFKCSKCLPLLNSQNAHNLKGRLKNLLGDLQVK